MTASRRQLLRGLGVAAATVAAKPVTRVMAQSTAPTGDVELLTLLLRLEHAGVHAYGRLGPLLAEPLQDLARRLADVHRLQRDALRRALLERNAEAPPPELAYALPLEARDATSARASAEAVERRALAGFHAALPDLEDRKARGLCGQMLVQTAVNLAELGRRRNPPAALPPFPGRPA